MGRFLALFLLLLTTLVGQAVPVRLDFVHEAAGHPVLLDTLRYPGAAGEVVSYSRVDWLASEVVLTTAEGEELRFPDRYGFVSGFGGVLNLGEIPTGTRITKLSFYVGPDERANHADPASFDPDHPLNPNLNKLHWDWQGGYIFMALEGHYRPPLEGAKPRGYSLHFARDPNRTRVTLPLEPPLELREPSVIVIALELEKLLRDLSLERDGNSTHSDEGDVVAEKLRANLPGAFRLHSVEAGGVELRHNPPAPIDPPANARPFALQLPPGVPLPKLPPDNPLLAERVKLGEKLFFDTALSRTGEVSCASCHQPDHAFSDPRRRSVGVEERLGKRHSMPLFNLAWKDALFWDGRAATLREQVKVPITDHLEMDHTMETAAQELRAEPQYPKMFAAAFGSGEITPENIALALENYLLTLTSLDSRFDRAMKGEGALTAEEQRGFELFFMENEPRMGKFGADCFHCHGGPLFTDNAFHNNGLRPTEDLGRETFSGAAPDRHKFSTPSLRNIALTAPYMHDGRFATLEEVMEHYNGPAHPSPTLDPNIAKHPRGLGLSEEDTRAVIAFLKALNDPRFE